MKAEMEAEMAPDMKAEMNRKDAEMKRKWTGNESGNRPEMEAAMSRK